MRWQDAMPLLTEGKRLKRPGWSKDSYLFIPGQGEVSTLVECDLQGQIKPGSKTLHQLLGEVFASWCKNEQGEPTPWTILLSHLMADDWEVLDV